jgi:hypothetical protein
MAIVIKQILNGKVTLRIKIACIFVSVFQIPETQVKLFRRAPIWFTLKVKSVLTVLAAALSLSDSLTTKVTVESSPADSLDAPSSPSLVIKTGGRQLRRPAVSEDLLISSLFATFTTTSISAEFDLLQILNYKAFQTDKDFLRFVKTNLLVSFRQMTYTSQNGLRGTKRNERKNSHNWWRQSWLCHCSRHNLQ